MDGTKLVAEYRVCYDMIFNIHYYGLTLGGIVAVKTGVDEQMYAGRHSSLGFPSDIAKASYCLGSRGEINKVSRRRFPRRVREYVRSI